MNNDTKRSEKESKNVGRSARSRRRIIVEWSLWIGIPAIIYLAGWHTEVLGGMQRLMLMTGLWKPDVEVRQNADAPVVDYSFALVSLDGENVPLSEYRGKVLFINFWATWCPPCVAEMPNIHDLYQEVDTERIVFLMVSLDDDPEPVRNFIQRKEYSFPVFRPAGALPPVFGGATIPRTFVIAPDGTVALQQSGMASYNSTEFKTFLHKLASVGTGTEAM